MLRNCEQVASETSFFKSMQVPYSQFWVRIKVQIHFFYV